MKTTFLIFLSVVLFFGSCKTSDKNTDNNNKFADVYQKLPVLSLPLTFKSFGDARFSVETPKFQDTLANRLLAHGWGDVLGRLPDSNGIRLVLSFFPDDVGTPFISSYSSQGRQIDSLWLFDDRPATTIGLISRQSVTITADHFIQFTDSSTYLDFDDNVYKTEVINKTYRIDDQGKIRQL